jgi:glycosyltransferase involved in cell wall biosynthesis
MAAGLPVVATRGGALPEIVVEGETGFLVERGDVQGLRAAISELLANPSLRQRMGAAGRQRVRELFTWDRCVAQLVELYARAETATHPAHHAERSAAQGIKAHPAGSSIR